MVAHLIGGLIRAAMVVIVIAAPSFLLPDVTVSSQEITLIVAGIAAAFTIFEYASSHPGLIDFRFAPPYNRTRYISFALLVFSLSFLYRASAGLDSFSADILALADRAVVLASFPYSPVGFVVDAAAVGADQEFRLLIERAAAVTFLLSFVLLGAFGGLLWLLRWPVARRDFNLWLNLPTFSPGPPAEAERRLFRDGFFNILASVIFVYFAPFVAAQGGQVIDPAGLRNPQVLVWGATIWGFSSGSLLIRGIAILKVGLLVRRTRLA